MTEAQNVLDLRAAVAKGGKVTVAPGRYYFKDTLVLSGLTSLIGEYRDYCVLDFTQLPAGKEALRIDRVWGYELSNLSIVGNRSNIGVLNSTTVPNANGSYGTCSGSAIWNHVIVYGFRKGIVIGDGTRYIAASENLYNGLVITQCDVGIELNDYNTLDHLFTMLQIGDCGTGMITNGAAYITVVGGSFSSIKGVLFNMSACEASRFTSCRMEESNIFLLCGTTCTVSNHVVEGCLLHQRAGLDKESTSMYANGWKSPLIVGGSANLTTTNTAIIQSGNQWRPILDMHNCAGGMIEATGNTATSPGPFISPNSNKTCRILAQRNQCTDAGQVFISWYPDQSN